MMLKNRHLLNLLQNHLMSKHCYMLSNLYQAIVIHSESEGTSDEETMDATELNCLDGVMEEPDRYEISRTVEPNHVDTRVECIVFPY